MFSCFPEILIVVFSRFFPQAEKLAAALGRAQAFEDVRPDVPRHVHAHRGGDDSRGGVLQAGVSESALLVSGRARGIHARQQGTLGPGGNQRRAGGAVGVVGRVPGRPLGADIQTSLVNFTYDGPLETRGALEGRGCSGNFSDWETVWFQRGLREGFGTSRCKPVHTVHCANRERDEIWSAWSLTRSYEAMLETRHSCIKEMFFKI